MPLLVSSSDNSHSLGSSRVLGRYMRWVSIGCASSGRNRSTSARLYPSSSIRMRLDCWSMKRTAVPAEAADAVGCRASSPDSSLAGGREEIPAGGSAAAASAVFLSLSSASDSARRFFVFPR